MVIKVLLNEGTELRIRLIGENHTSLQLLRTNLNNNKDIDYSNYFTGHPGLDDPELYIRAKKGKNAAKILKAVNADLQTEFSSASLS